MSGADRPPVRLDVANERAWCGERLLDLTPKTFAILRHLVEHPDRLLTKDDLLAAVWGDTVVSEAALTSCIRDVRRALEDSSRTPRYIETVHRRGFRFIGPVAAVRPLAPVPPPPASDAAPAMVGRAAELDRLREIFASVGSGRRRLVFVTGEAGIGKTTLVDAFVTELPAGVRVGRGQCVEHYGTGEPFLPVLEALTRLARAPGGDAVVRAIRRWAPSWLVQLAPVMAADDAELAQRRAQGTTADRSLRELAEALEAIGTESPLVLVLEDLHWSDAATIDLLAVVARRRDAARLLVVGTHRPADVAAASHPLKPLMQELRAHGDCDEVALPFLGEAAVGDYVAGRLSDPECSPDLVRLLYENTGGNPLFLANVVDDLIARGHVQDVDGRWTLSAPLDRIASEVPASLWQLIDKQIDRLEPEARAVLAVGSIAGAEFSSALATTEGVDALAAEARCAALAQQGRFLRALGVAEWPDRTVAGRYGFIHAFHRTVLASRVSIAERVGLHCRIGARLERAFGTRAGEIAGELATHFDAGRDFERGLQYRMQAAENALRHHGHREAVQHARRALELLATLPESPERLGQELMIQTTLGTALIARGWAAPDVAAALARARELCTRLGATLELFPILIGLFGYYITRAELSVARDVARQIVGLSRTSDDSALQLCAHNVAGMVALYGGDFAAALADAERGLAIYDPVLHHPDRALVFRGQVVGVSCIVHAAWALWSLGSFDRAAARIHEAVTVARDSAHPVTLALACHFAATFFEVERDPETAARFADEGIRLSRDEGFDLYASLAEVHTGWQRGDPDEMQRGVAAYEATGSRFGLPTYLGLLASAYGAAGRATEGLAVVAQASAMAEETDVHYWDGEIERLRGVLTADPGESEACFERAIAIARGQRAPAFELRTTTSLARLWRDAGRRADARERLSAVYAAFTEGFATADLRDARTLLDELGGPAAPAGRSTRARRRPT